MSVPVYLDKQEVVATLRSRGLDGRADWVDRTFSASIHVAANAALLGTLGIDPEEPAHREVALDHSR